MDVQLGELATKLWEHFVMFIFRVETKKWNFEERSGKIPSALNIERIQNVSELVVRYS